MDLLFSLLFGIISLGMDMFFFVIRLILAIAVGVIAQFKRRNGLFYGTVTFIFPWFVIIMPFIPTRIPKLPPELRNEDAFKDKNPVVAAVMALAAIVAKSDGNVSKEEVSRIKQVLMNQFRLSMQEINTYGDAFNYGKTHPHQYMLFTTIIKEYYGQKPIWMAYLLIQVATDDGEIATVVEEQIKKITYELNISEYEYQSIKNSFRAQSSGGYYGQSGGYGGYGGFGQNQGMSQQGLIKKYSEVLGVSETASMAEIKKAYRKLAKEYHPDKFTSENMPDNYIEFANKKIAEINEAYEYLKSVKE